MACIMKLANSDYIKEVVTRFCFGFHYLKQTLGPESLQGCLEKIPVEITLY